MTAKRLAHQQQQPMMLECDLPTQVMDDQVIPMGTASNMLKQGFQLHSSQTFMVNQSKSDLKDNWCLQSSRIDLCNSQRKMFHIKAPKNENMNNQIDRVSQCSREYLKLKGQPFTLSLISDSQNKVALDQECQTLFIPAATKLDNGKSLHYKKSASSKTIKKGEKDKTMLIQHLWLKRMNQKIRKSNLTLCSSQDFQNSKIGCDQKEILLRMFEDQSYKQFYHHQSQHAYHQQQHFKLEHHSSQIQKEDRVLKIAIGSPTDDESGISQPDLLSSSNSGNIANNQSSSFSCIDELNSSSTQQTVVRPFQLSPQPSFNSRRDDINSSSSED